MPRPSSVETSSSGTSHAPSSASTVPPINYSLTLIEVSTDSPGTSSESVLDYLSQTKIPASELIPTSTSSALSALVQISVDNVPYNSPGTITSLEPTRVAPKHHIHPTTPSAAPLTTTPPAGMNGPSIARPTSSAADALKNSTPSKAPARPWWQKWVDPLITLVTGSRG